MPDAADQNDPPDGRSSRSWDPAELRRCAEQRVQNRGSGDSAPADMLALLHELQVHQVELEMQNEALRATQSELEVDLARFVELGDLGPVGYIGLTRDGTITRLNLAAAGLLGLRSADPGGRRLGAYLGGASLQAFNDFLEKLFDTGARQFCELAIEPDGSADGVVLHVEGVRDRNHPICHLAAVNITERRRAERELTAAKAEAERANEAKSRFVAAASHDLRQPLAALALYVDILSSELPQDTRVPVQSMKDCVSSLSGLLNDLFDLSKLDAGVVTPNALTFPLTALLDRLLSAHAPESRRKGIELRHRACDWVVHTDPVVFERIAGNFVANAIRYTERGGVLIACRRRLGKRWFEVWDTGIGIEAGSLGEIFDEFKQLGNEQRSPGKGSGLGLAIATRAAGLLGLQIRVRSRLGRGSMFAIELPEGGRMADAAEPDAAMVPLTIGLVEDNAAVREALMLALRASGHEVIGACSGRELVALCGARVPDVVVSDFRLGPQECGLDVIAAARAAFGSCLPAVIVTGDTDPRIIRRIADAGIALEHKPIALDALQQRIMALVRRH